MGMKWYHIVGVLKNVIIEKGEGFIGTSVKVTWTKPKGGVGPRVGGGDGCGKGSGGGKWRQLYLNNNKKV